MATSISKTQSRLYRGTALGLSLAVSLTFGHAALAQDAPAAKPAAAESQGDIVVTGSRAQHRSRLNSVVPVDVVTSQTLQAQGSTELGQGLSRIAPSLNFPRPSAVDGTDNIRPASLRGLSPDQTLVLVDGKRRHTSALVNINGSAGRGSVAVDLNAIPEVALDRIEVLRDGASAQYGSDAIAGVINLHLREANHGGGVTASYGEYDTDEKAGMSSRKIHDGQTSDVNGWIGLPLGDKGFVTISADLKHRDFTNRADIDPTTSPQVVTSRYGDPEQRSVSVFVNAGLPLNDDWSLYGNANYSGNDSKSAAFFRHSNASGNVASFYPNGFLPIINARSKDAAGTFGIRGHAGDWTQDYSLTYGSNTLDYYTLDSVNASYGTASQTSFYDGRLKYGQLVFNADASRTVEVGLSSPLTVAIGLEARHETYTIGQGELQSYSLGPLTTKPAGAQGFGGFLPDNVVDKGRDNVGVYVDLSGNFTPKLSYDGAVRLENYSDFGSNTSGKLALRYDFTDAFALRGAVSTGFRAPSLAQQYFTSTASTVTSGVLFETGTFPATSPVGTTLGGQALEAEKSTSTSLGLVWHKGPFEVTVDGYHIDLNNRIVLSENIGGTSQVLALLAPYGVTQARFFINGVDSTTDGVDIVANYRIPTDFGRFNLSLAWNNNNTTIDKLPALSNSPLTPQPVLFARIRQLILTNSAPENKGTFAVDWSDGAWGVTARATYYGDVIDPASVYTNDIHTGKKTLVDLSASYRFKHNTTLSFGADNLFDVYPKATLASLNTQSGNGAGALAFTRFSPFGFNGRYLYAKVSQSF